mmetsp:Transcript_12308/g.35269  ORF Transcript_12308/g.35269 Transcript_12308/m.35269 type:complete len:223 (-) Transcript_12308:292-960(-)
MHRKSVKQDSDNVPKTSAPFLDSAWEPSSSRKTKAAEYKGKAKSSIEKPSVRMPPSVPVMSTESSLKMDKRPTRAIRATRSKRKTLNITNVEVPVSLDCGIAKLRATSMKARMTSATSKECQRHSGPRKYMRRPLAAQLMTTSDKKMTAKLKSTMVQPSQSGLVSQLMPIAITFRTMTALIHESHTTCKLARIPRCPPFSPPMSAKLASLSKVEAFAVRLAK